MSILGTLMQDAPYEDNKKQIVVDYGSDVDWKVGETVAIASTTMRTMDAEKCVIEAINGGYITCEDEIEAFHYGESAPTYEEDSNLDGVDMRAEVVLLDRNITIRANSSGDFWGCRIVVADWLDTGFIAQGMGL